MEKMKLKQNFDKKIREALQEECGKILASAQLKQRIDEKINLEQEEKKMKHINMKKVGIGVAAACLLVSGVTFAGKTVGFSTHGTNLSEFASFAALDKAEEQLGYQIDCVEQFNNGYTFAKADIAESAALDENGNILYTIKELYIDYEKAGEPVICLGIEKPVEKLESGKIPDATRVCGDITIAYDAFTYKCVPLDYELTEEDMENMKKDNYNISVGSDEVLIQQCYNITWDKGDIRYILVGFDLNLSADELFNMAEEIINAD